MDTLRWNCVNPGQYKLDDHLADINRVVLATY